MHAFAKIAHHFPCAASVHGYLHGINLFIDETIKT